MGVHILRDKHESCMYCSTSMFAFGPVFNDGEEPDEFIDWLGEDPRGLSDKDLARKYAEWQVILEEEQEEITGHKNPNRVNEDDIRRDQW